MTPNNSQLTSLSLTRTCTARAGMGGEVQPKRFSGFALIAFLLAILAQPAPLAAQGVIFVTSFADKVNGIGGCSLQEAIYAANLRESTAIVSYAADGTPNTVPTQCVAGTGNDRIILPTKAVFVMNQVVLDASNPFGATATPMISTQITIEGNGSTLQWTGSKNARAFTVASTGNLTLLDIYIRDFHVKGGDGGSGGGGGLGAGGAIYVKGDGGVIVERSTFSGNQATGGNGAETAFGGGGGGLGGNGGTAPTDVISNSFGGGGGGAIGDGAGHSLPLFGLGGGGTIYPPGVIILDKQLPSVLQGGFMCGARGGAGDREDGFNAPCPGGGGGGGNDGGLLFAGNGGFGSYGGGGGGGGQSANGDRANGGGGGFGGGGGAGWQDDFGSCGGGSSGGAGGFGGGGGAGPGGLNSGGPGHGGTFGGDATCENGGGGAALGGAIFSDGGHLQIHNSTFNLNIVAGGHGALLGQQPGGPGTEHGAAIFATHGTVDIRNSTFAVNTGVTIPDDVFVYQPDGFILYNTIFDSFQDFSSCVVTGSNNLTGAGNVITGPPSFCPGVISSGSSQVGPLALNFPGITPTMAIGKNSPAFDAADASSSFSIDQRGFPRPQESRFDVGAFELCIPKGILAFNCTITPVLNPNPPTMVNLFMRVSPDGAGTTIPMAATGPYAEALNSVLVVSTAPNPGYGFLNWTGGVVDPTNPSTTVIIDQGKTITANFAVLSATMAGNIIAKTGPVNARVWTLSLLDNGPGAATSVSIPNFTLTQTFGAACKPILKNAAPFPLLLSNLGPAQTGTTTVTLDFTGCAASARFTAKFTYSANSGAVSGFVTRTNQYQ
jgi:CSLREA domain-containing protein